MEPDIRPGASGAHGLGQWRYPDPLGAFAGDLRFVPFYGSGLGDVELAANQILVQFLQITAYGLDGFAFAAEALVGSAFGAGSVARLRRGALLTSGWGAIICLSLSVVFLIFGATIIDIMTTAPEVRAAARVYLIYMALAPILGVAAWMFDGIFIGATRSRDMRNMMVISAAVYFAAVAVLLPAFGNHGLWIALLISLVVRGVTLGARYPALGTGRAGAELKASENIQNCLGRASNRRLTVRKEDRALDQDRVGDHRVEQGRIFGSREAKFAEYRFVSAHHLQGFNAKGIRRGDQFVA